jgi:hypothetical protein
MYHPYLDIRRLLSQGDDHAPSPPARRCRSGAHAGSRGRNGPHRGHAYLNIVCLNIVYINIVCLNIAYLNRVGFPEAMRECSGVMAFSESELRQGAAELWEAEARCQG